MRDDPTGGVRAEAASLHDTETRTFAHALLSSLRSMKTRTFASSMDTYPSVHSVCGSASRVLAAGVLASLVLSCRPPATTTPSGTVEAPPPEQATPSTTARELPADPPSDAEMTPGGVAMVWLATGDSEAPSPTTDDRVELRYRVWDEEGALVGRSPGDRTEWLEMRWLPKGWAEAMFSMHAGAHAHLWIPAALAYADGPGPAGMLVIDVELVSVEVRDTTKPEAVPLTSIPRNALRTASGLAFVILRHGHGERHPTADDRVVVHYEGWTADGKSFDSSYTRGKPVTLPIRGVIKGWQEALPLMVEGEKSRFWIPEELAYGQTPGRPNGMLIFDIELIRIEP